MPFWLPTKRRPPATVGCDQAEVASGKPKAHLSVSFGTVCSDSPACAAVWKRVLALVGDQPLQRGASGATTSGGLVLHLPKAAPVTSPPSTRPVRCSATARRSAPVRRPPCGRMPPAVSAERMASGERRLSTSGAGARVSAAPVWQLLHSRAKIAAPSGACAESGALARSARPATNDERRVVARMGDERLLALGSRRGLLRLLGTASQAQRQEPRAQGPADSAIANRHMSD